MNDCRWHVRQLRNIVYNLVFMDEIFIHGVMYFNPRINNVDKVYQEIPTDNTCEYTQEKDTLDNVKLSDRLDPTMLDPFKQNPYTQSLASFAY